MRYSSTPARNTLEFADILDSLQEVFKYLRMRPQGKINPLRLEIDRDDVEGKVMSDLPLRAEGTLRGP